jgi:RNA polymerase subunit RPABC4/transcription elongation factor Spt4/TM2 domain-containing membrane protein YozV
MALIPCRECHREISSEAPACPHCGAPSKSTAATARTSCRHCGTLIAAGTVWCPNCTTEQPEAVQPGVVLVRASKSRGVFIILGLFLGCLGIHNFYAGYYAKGAIQLVITVVLGWMIVGLVITGIWALIEVITVTADAQGHAMS